MANTVASLIEGQTGVLTVGSEDMGAILVTSFTPEIVDKEHEDSSAGANDIDLIISRLRKVTIEATIEECADMDKMAMILGAGTATDDAFEMAPNTNDYYVSLVFTLQNSDELRYRHSKMRIKPNGPIDFSGGDFAGTPLLLTSLKDSSGAYGDHGKWDVVTPS